MWKVTNIYNDERGFVTDSRQFILKPKESVIVKKKPDVSKEIFKVEEVGQEEKIKQEEKQQKSEVKK